jgi:alcohol dehydrogenase class IV
MYPIIVIPTTAGTGSEATPGGVITDTKEDAKRNVPCMSNLGIVDPDLTLGLPPIVTATTAVDALCHSAEAYTSNKPNAINDIFCSRSIQLIGENLPKVFDNPSDADAREGLSLAATLGGLGLMGPFCHVPHEIGLILGAKLHIAHGTACGMTLPEGMRFIAPAMKERVTEIVRWLGGEVADGASGEEIGEAAYQTIAALYEKIGFPKLSSYGTEEEILSLIPEIMNPYPFIHSPREVSEEDVREVLVSAYRR